MCEFGHKDDRQKSSEGGETTAQTAEDLVTEFVAVWKGAGFGDPGDIPPEEKMDLLSWLKRPDIGPRWQKLVTNAGASDFYRFGRAPNQVRELGPLAIGQLILMGTKELKRLGSLAAPPRRVQDQQAFRLPTPEQIAGEERKAAEEFAASLAELNALREARGLPPAEPDIGPVDLASQKEALRQGLPLPPPLRRSRQ